MASSIDTHELQKFSVNTDQWWNEQGPYRLLHRINPVRLKYIRLQIERQWSLQPDNPYQQLKMLDVGCGGGLLCEPLVRLGATVTGIDAVENNILTAQAHAAQFNLAIAYQTTTIEAWQSTEKYDVVIIFELLEHVANPEEFLNHCLNVLKPQGLLIVSTFNRTLKSYLLGIAAAEYILRWVPQGTHDWQKFLKPSEIALLLTEQGCTIQDITGLRYNCWHDQWVLKNPPEVNYFLTAQRSFF